MVINGFRAEICRLLWLVMLFVWVVTPGAAKEAWVEVKSPHFVACSDAGENQAREVLLQFEGIREAFRLLFPDLRVDPPKPVRILVLKDAESMKRFLPRSFQGKDPVKHAGYFSPGPDCAYAVVRMDLDVQSNQPYFVLFHEYTHLIINFNFPRLPTWLNEGLADFYGSTQILSDKVHLGKVPLARRGLLQNRGFLPLEELFAVNQDSPHYQEGEKAGLFYAESWAMVHYLFMEERPRQAGLLTRYLSALDRNLDPVAAGKEGFGNLNEALNSLIAYARQPIFRFAVYPLKVKLLEKDFPSRPMDAVEVLALKAEFLLYSSEQASSDPYIQQGLSLAPQRPEVLAVNGLSLFKKGQFDQSKTALEEALRLGSRDFRVPLYLARLARQGFGPADGNRSRVREWLDIAIRLAPESSDAHMLLCMEFAQDSTMTMRAFDEGERAVALDPGNLVTRANFGSALLAMGREAEAMQIGKQLDRLARSEAETAIAASYANMLARSLEAKQAIVPKPVDSPSTVEGPMRVRQVIPGKAIRFSVPDHLIPFGQEVLSLFSAGKTDEAIKKVEAALARTKRKDDRKAFEAILNQLKGTL